MRISDWSSDVCSSDLAAPVRLLQPFGQPPHHGPIAATTVFAQPQRAQRQAGRVLDPAVADSHKFETAAAKIGDHSARAGKSTNHALRAQPRLLGARDQPRGKANLSDLFKKLPAVEIGRAHV